MQVFIQICVKGPDLASVSVESANGNTSKEGHVDEINKFVNSRFVTASMGRWQIFSSDGHGRIVTFNEGNSEQAISNPKDTTLLAWFKLNQADPDARSYKYHEITQHYVWNSHQHKWTRRQKCKCIGHLQCCHYFSDLWVPCTCIPTLWWSFS